MKQTAIDWLIDQLEKYELYSKISFQCLKEIEQAKEMENIQLQKAIEYGYELRNNNKPINSGIDWVKEFNSLNKQD